MIALLVLILCAQDKPLGTMPENASGAAVNAGATAVAWIEDGKKVVCGGIAGSDFDEVRHLRIDGNGVVAYAARTGTSWVVVCGSEKSKPFDEVTPPLLESGTVAFAGRRGKSWVAVAGEVEGPAFDAISGLALSPDGEQFVYAGRNGTKTRLILGEHRGPEFEKITAVVFSEDGTRVAYAVTQGKESWYVEGLVEPESASIALYRTEPEGRTLVTLGLYDLSDRAAALKLMKDWEKEEIVPSIEIDAQVPWKDVRPLLQTCRDAGLHQVTFAPPGNHQPFETFDVIDALSISPDGKRVALIGNQGGKKRVFMGGKQSEEFDAVAGLTSGANRSMAYRMKIGSDWFAVLGQRGKPGDPYKEVGDPVLSPDGKQMAYAAFDGKAWIVVAADRKSDKFDQVWRPVFTEDGVVFAARVGRELKRVILPPK
jgi:hypothetical protein